MSQRSFRDQYFDTEVLTATPQRLRLLLIEGAIRFGRQAQQAMRDQDRGAAAQAADRCAAILAELLSTIQIKDDTTRRIAGVYGFALTEIAEIRLQGTAESWSRLLEILEIERETWEQVCQIQRGQHESADIQSNPQSALTTSEQGSNSLDHLQSGSFEIDA